MLRSVALQVIPILVWSAACSSVTEDAGRSVSATKQALTVPPGFQDSVVLGGLSQPTAVRFAGDGRIFVAEKSGLVKVVDPARGGDASVFADLRTNVHNYWDRGLMDLELHPDFPATPYVYVLYAHDAELGGTAPRWGSVETTMDSCPTPPGPTALGCVVSGRLSRLTAEGDVWSGVEDVLIENWPQQFPSHSLGSIAFGPDGMLYVTGGDGASFDYADYGQVGEPLNPLGDPPVAVGEEQMPPEARGGALRSQNVSVAGFPAVFSGKLLRVDPLTGQAPDDNPLSGSVRSDARSIVASGLRNPYRMAFRPQTDELWIGDVGWGSWEEINRLIVPPERVANFGWPCFEGPIYQTGYSATDLALCEELYDEEDAHVTPHYSYAHDGPVAVEDGCSWVQGSAIAGLAFYTEGLYPDEYRNALFFADYARECIWVMLPDAEGVPDPTQRRVFARGVDQPVQLTIGPGNDLYYVSHSGELHRISSLGENQPPIARIQLSPSSGPLPLTVALEGSLSDDPDPGDTLNYAWDLDGDGAFDDAAGSAAAYVYSGAGEHRVGLRVTDSRGAIATAFETVSAGEDTGGPVATIVSVQPQRFIVGDVLQFRGRASEGETELAAASFHWEIVLQHCPVVDTCHPHVVESLEGVDTGSFVMPEHAYPYYVDLILRVEGSDGRFGTAVARLDPISVDLTVESEPAGLELAFNQAARRTPFMVQVAAGSTNAVNAPNHAGYAFMGWSDDGTRAHVLTADASGTLRASYQQAPFPASLKQLGRIIARVSRAEGGGSESPEVIRDEDSPPRGTINPERQYDTYTRDFEPKEDWIGYEFDAPHSFSRIAFQEGINFGDGGWFEQLGVRVRTGGEWQTVQGLSVDPLYSGMSDGVGFRGYQIDFEASVGDAIQIFGPAGGEKHFVSIAELDVFGWRAISGSGSLPIARIARLPAPILPEDKLTLDGRASYDPNGGALQFSWTQTAGPAVTMNGADSAQVRIVIPHVRSATDLRFALTVSSGGLASAPAAVDLHITPLTAPVDITARGDILVSEPLPEGNGGSPNIEIIRDGDWPAPGSILDLSQYDNFSGAEAVPEGYVGYEFPETHHFSSLEFIEGKHFPDGGWFTALGVEVRQDGRWVPVGGQRTEPVYPGINDGVGFERYVFTFTPTLGDGIRLIGPPAGARTFFSIAELRAFASTQPAANTAPIAHAGIDFTAPFGARVTLDGTLAHDPNGTTVSYDWRQTSGPPVQLENRTSVSPSFVTPIGPEESQLTFALTVGDGTALSRADAVSVSLREATTDDITALGTILASERRPKGGGSQSLEVIRDGEYPTGTDLDIARQYDTYDGNLHSEAFIGYQFQGGHLLAGLVFQEGHRWDGGGYFDVLTVEVRRGGVWRPVSALEISPAYPKGPTGAGFQTYSIAFTPVVAEAVRLRGVPGGDFKFLSVGELRVIAR